MLLDEKYMDVLQNIEFAIQQVYKDYTDLTDYDVLFALDALIDFYMAEERKREPRKFNLSEKSVLVYEEMKVMCEFRLRISDSADKILESRISLSEIQYCLKKIKSSLNKWTKSGGKRGYLDYVKQFVR